MRLLLTSAGFESQAAAEAFMGLLGKPAKEARVLFIPTAAQSEEALYYVEKCKKELRAAGINRDNLHIYDLDLRMAGDEIGGYDAVYVCGGDTRHLLKRVKRTGFGKALAAYDGLYVGVSAGSLIMAPHIDPYRHNGRTKAMGRVSCHIRVHCQKGAPEGKIDTKGCPVIPLTDRQALIVEDDTVTLIQ